MTSREVSPAWWIAAFVVHRAVLVALGFDGLYFWEETYRLLVAEALRSGWDIPLRDLQADPYNGGSLVFSALTALVTTLTGPSLLALKGVALAWSAAGLALWLRVAERIAGRSTAHLLGFLWLAAPPVFVVFNVLGLGSHSDTVTLTGAQLLLMLRYIDDPERSSGRLAAWTAVGGLGVWFGYASAPSLAVAVLWAFVAGALPVRSWPVAAAGFLAGLSPWIAYTLTSGGTFDVVSQTFAAGATPSSSRGYFATLYDVAVRGVPVALYFRDIGIPGDVKVPRAWIAYPYLAVYVAAFVGVMASIARRFADSARGGGALSRIRAAAAASPELAIVAVFPAFLLLVAASNQEFNDYGIVRWITFRILVPALPSLLFTVALALGRVKAPLRVTVTAVVAVTALIGSGQILVDRADAHAAREEEAREVGAEAMGHLIVFKHGTDPVYRERITAMPPELRARAYRGLGFSFVYLYGTKRKAAPATELTNALLAINAENKSIALEGAQAALAAGMAQVAPLPASPRREELALAIALAN